MDLSGKHSPKKEFYAQQSRRKWTEEEDSICRSVVEEEIKKNNGNIDGVDWTLVEKALNGTRNVRQCKERWRLRLDPAINKEPWTTSDDQILLQLQSQLGNQWTTICKRFPGRSDHACKCRWMALMRERKRNGKLRTESSMILLPPYVGPNETESKNQTNPENKKSNNGGSKVSNSNSSNKGNRSMSTNGSSQSSTSMERSNNSNTNENESYPTTSDTSGSAQNDGSDPLKSTLASSTSTSKEEEEDGKSSSSDSGDQSGSGSGSGSNLESISKRRRLSEDATIADDLGNDSNANITNNTSNQFNSASSDSQASVQAQIFSNLNNRRSIFEPGQFSSGIGNMPSPQVMNNNSSNLSQFPTLMNINLGMGNGQNPLLFNGQYINLPSAQSLTNSSSNQGLPIGAAPMMVVPISSIPQNQFQSPANNGPYVLVPASSLMTNIGNPTQQATNSAGYLIPMVVIPNATTQPSPSNLGLQMLSMPSMNNNLSNSNQQNHASSVSNSMGAPSNSMQGLPTMISSPFVFPSFSQFSASSSTPKRNSSNHMR